MSVTEPHSEAALRHRLLEGLLLRLARLPDPRAFVLRGGMLLRHWFWPRQRVAHDLDLVATFPYSVANAAEQFSPVLSDAGVADGVSFDAERHRVEAIWTHTDFPGVRIFATGEIGGEEADCHIDLTFGEPLVPAPTLGDVPMRTSSLVAQLWLSRPETIVGRKLHALMHMGMQHWRPKDLSDLRLLLADTALDTDGLVAGIATSFTSRGTTTDAARTIFQHDWWRFKTTAVRWRDFVRGASGLDMPENLQEVLTEVAEQLTPILERLP